jgi:hypothetical protein
MDPISLAIIAALSAGAAGGTTEVGKSIVTDAYTVLKSRLKKKFGHQNELIDTLDRLEQKPDVAGRKQAFAAEIIATKVNDDPDVLAAAKALLRTLKEQPEGENQIQMAQGRYIAQADRGSTATVNVSGSSGNKDA